MRLRLLTVVAGYLTGFVIGQAPAGFDPARDTLVYVGSQGAAGKGIYAFRLQSAGTDVFQNVTLVPLGLAAEAENAAFLELDTANRRLFAVNDIEPFNGTPSGAITAYAIDGAGKLALINRRASEGARPCHLALHADRRSLLVANCGTGNIVVVRVGLDGHLGETADTKPVSAAAPCVAFDPAGRFAFACDHASDTIATFAFDAARGQLTARAMVPLKPGMGPRQIVFRPDGRFAYVLNSKASTITVFSYDDATGTLGELQTISTVPEYFDGANIGGELHMHRTGKWLYASNVGHNSVVLFTTDFEKGTLAFVEEQGTGGKTPRHFGIEPSAKHLAISNTDSDTVLASRIDEGNGRLKPSGIFAAVPSPAGIRFLPPLSGVASK
jgi:6-phosphogluconolactonase